MKRIILGIEGMSCSACSQGIEKYIKKQDGIVYVSVNLVMANATIDYDETKLDKAKIEKFIKDVGFKSTGIYKLKNEKEGNKEKILFIIFSILAVAVLYISMFSMFGVPLPRFLDYNSNPKTYAIVLLVLVIPFLIYGFDVIKSGIKCLILAIPNMDTLVALGVISSLGYSIYSFVMIMLGGSSFVHNLYFESCAIIIYFIKLGRFIDKTNKAKTRDAIKKLVQITPSVATLKVGREEKEVTIDEIQKGDIVICKPGEKIAVDGIIVSGETHIDESFITGESMPVKKANGDNVVAGSINFDGYIEYEAKRIGKESTVSEIVRLVVEATNTKMKISKLADKVSGIFVPCVMAIALITFIVYLCLGQGFNVALNFFVTVLVVACPCALGLSTPLAIVISEGKCASRGILVKNSETLEIASKVNTVVFDKTGTLTYGNLKIAKFINFSKMDEKEILKYVYSLEKLSSHPIKNAFIESANTQNIKGLNVSNFENIDGMGIIGDVEGERIICGNYKLLEKYKIKNDYQDKVKEVSELGSFVYVVINKELVGLYIVSDIIKEDAKDIVKCLQSRHIEVVMLSGDSKEVAERRAEELNMKTVFSEVLPSEKSKIINELKKQNKVVLMCGDGVNDSPALATSDIGVSVSNGTDIAISSSDVVLMSDNLMKIVDLLDIGKKTIKNIKQNLFWAFFYNTLMIPIATGMFSFLGIVINPMIAGISMVLSSLTVVLNALRLKR